MDPATGKGDIDVAADYMRLLAAPPTLNPGPSARLGELLFQQVGCAVCHVPVIPTGFSPVQALNQKPVWLDSDLLPHGDADRAALGTAASAPYLHAVEAAAVEQQVGEAQVVTWR